MKLGQIDEFAVGLVLLLAILLSFHLATTAGFLGEELSKAVAPVKNKR